jgi:uncharacterized membrane protein YkvA (DUF1232 family)
MAFTNNSSGRATGSLADVIRNLRLTWNLIRDRRVPLWLKGIPFLALVYILWPVDLVADILPGLGQLDDLTVILLGLMAFVALCPADLVRQHRQRMAMGNEREARAHAETVDTSYRVLREESIWQRGDQ